jgi:hypothetical protein
VLIEGPRCKRTFWRSEILSIPSLPVFAGKIKRREHKGSRL